MGPFDIWGETMRANQGKEEQRYQQLMKEVKSEVEEVVPNWPTIGSRMRRKISKSELPSIE